MAKSRYVVGRNLSIEAFDLCRESDQVFVVSTYYTYWGALRYTGPVYIGKRSDYRCDPERMSRNVKYRIIVKPKRGVIVTSKRKKAQ